MPSVLDLLELRDRAPGWARDLAVAHPTPVGCEDLHVRSYPVLAGRRFRTVRRLLEESQWWSPAQLRDFQVTQLRALVARAAQTPHYARLFKEAGLDPRGPLEPEDLACLPYLEKEELRAHYDDLVVPGTDLGKMRVVYTGGTTSSGVALYESADSWAFESAFFHRWYGWFGCRVGERAAVIQGSYVTRDADYNPVANSMHLYVRGLDRRLMDQMATRLEAFSPRRLHGYPSILAAMAATFERSGRALRLPRLQRVFFTSEQVTDRQAAVVQRVFGVPTASHYGQAERVALMQQCPASDLQHVIPEYGLVELIGRDGLPVREPGQLGTIVGTGFANTAAPLIRYRTLDWAVLAAPAPCPHCGRHYASVERIEGRSGDLLKTPSGKVWSPTVLDFVYDDEEGHIQEMQIWQPRLDLIVILVVPGREFVAADAEIVASALGGLIGEAGLRLEIRLVERIARPRSMKQRFVRSDVPGPF